MKQKIKTTPAVRPVRNLTAKLNKTRFFEAQTTFSFTPSSFNGIPRPAADVSKAYARKRIAAYSFADGYLSGEQRRLLKAEIESV